MEKYFEVLREVKLFHGIKQDQLKALLGCLNARMMKYDSGNIIFLAGDAVSEVGIVCEGSVQIVREDVFGNRTILAKISAGGLFGEAFACAGVDTLPVSVIVGRGCVVLMIDYRRIITTCASSCDFHSRLIGNMLRVLAEKNLMLNQKIEALAARGIRGKLTAYLLAEAKKAGSRSFTIPFNRQDMADYLSVDRSAMSAELSRMRREGLLRFSKSNFELIRLE